MQIVTTELVTKKDQRGKVIEIIRGSTVNNGIKGQIFISTAFSGQIKGNHYHKRKTEWYCVIKGEGLLILTDPMSGEKQEITMRDDPMSLVAIPPNILHTIKNVGNEEMYLLVYIDEEFNPDDPDTYPAP